MATKPVLDIADKTWPMTSNTYKDMSMSHTRVKTLTLMVVSHCHGLKPRAEIVKSRTVYCSIAYACGHGLFDLGN